MKHRDLSGNEMLNLNFKKNSQLGQLILRNKGYLTIDAESPEEKVRLLIVRDLLRVGWEMTIRSNSVSIKPPESYNKQLIQESMNFKRQESIAQKHDWIQGHIKLAQENLADGESVWKSPIEPFIETCETQKQQDLFRILRYYWSSPYSEYVGRRIKLIIRDNALPNKPVIGIAALGSSIIHIPERDKWIGWDVATRTNNLIYTMDAYVVGALPPYNYLLGGKLISYLLSSNEVREIYKSKYKDKVTNQNKRTANDLACIFTTSLYGRSSQYNRITYEGSLIYQPIGYTKGYGTFHLSDETFQAMRDFLITRNINITNRFGDGPIWRMRVINAAAEILGFDADFLLRHSFRRGIYAVSMAENFKRFLNGQDEDLRYFNRPQDNVTKYWRERWLNKRKQDPKVLQDVNNFRRASFNIN